MRGVNKVILVGTLGRDPETKTFPNGGSLTQFSIATSESWTDKNTGERKEQTEWHRIVLHNRLGEIAQQYLRKGSKVYIEGSLRTRQWTDQNGQERYTTEIRGDICRAPELCRYLVSKGIRQWVVAMILISHVLIMLHNSLAMVKVMALIRVTMPIILLAVMAMRATIIQAVLRQKHLLHQRLLIWMMIYRSRSYI